MAAEFNKTGSPKRSALEADDGCIFDPMAAGGSHLAKQNLFGGRGLDVCDSGVSMTSVCEAMPSLSITDPVKPQLPDLETPNTFVSVGYTSFGGPEDTLEEQMESLDISSTAAVTTTTSSRRTTATGKTQTSVDPRRALVDRLQFCFTPDDDGDT